VLAFRTSSEGLGEQSPENVGTGAAFFLGDLVDLGDRLGVQSDGVLLSGHVIERSTSKDDKSQCDTMGYMTRFEHDDGGREAAGFTGTTGDCVTRAIAIATGLPYREVYDALHARAKARGDRKPSPRDGASRKDYQPYLESLGWRWVPTMHIGSGCTVHLRADELPPGRLVVCLSRHMCAVVDGVVRDNHDPRRGGTRCVYGYFTEPGGSR
jgi:hypothetical protein